jgi:hypothetical protein
MLVFVFHADSLSSSGARDVKAIEDPSAAKS